MGYYISLRGHRMPDGQINPFNGSLTTTPLNYQIASVVYDTLSERYGLKIKPNPSDVGSRRLASYEISCTACRGHKPNLVKVGSRVGSMIVRESNHHK